MFENGEIILYQNGERYEVGIVKERHDNYEEIESYRVYYHSGDTTALTNATDMKKISNESMLPEMFKRFLEGE
ncbi:hypothetical protein [Enterococcus faecalis]|uniref:hypothetical protein n=1 Tax=Enterococcus faecalis TaxID=1351 RepID=UPI00044CD7E9|nr:hypothetical protein [Enterococcus faecalis]MDU2073382.1 hypothetical protein [Streptococcus salivarius]MDU6989863.1 hypothetical protein [Escherichia coli]ETU35167.1 hypothetical protein P017_02943 [Enterococcus faecalis EnGen0417]MDU7309313.1 hypothetical protein [Enterococcus faecalis]HBI1870150.1 hypothetical protein [Enterococcus faecalis]